MTPMDGMPEPGDPCPDFIVDVGRCWQMVYGRNLQANHCPEAPSWTGRWSSPKVTAGGGCGPVTAIRMG